MSGALLESYTYDLAGTPTFYNPSGTVLPNGSVYGINHLFTGQQWHASLGLYDLRNRFYLPSLGRFLQPDPIGFSGDPANLYRYCGNNPANWIDPSGLELIAFKKNKTDAGGSDSSRRLPRQRRRNPWKLRDQLWRECTVVPRRRRWIG